MKAILQHRYGPASVLQMGEAPKPIPRSGEVLVRIQAAALNPVDCEMRKGHFWPLSGIRFPRIPGSDFAGVVESTGTGVTGQKPGDAVYGFSPTYRGGSYAAYIAIPARAIACKPESLSFGEAAGIPLAAQTALQALRNLGHLQAGQSVFIHGASGGVGKFAVQIAAILGAQVHASCSFRNTEAVKALGAETVIDYTQNDIRKLGREYDIFFDVYGNMPLPRVWHQVAKRGIHISTIPSPVNFWRAANPLSKRKTRVVLVRSVTADLDLLSNWVEEGKLASIIDRTYPLEQAREAHEYLETRRATGKIVLNIA